MSREMRRKDRLIPDERARGVIEKCEYGVFITADKEGHPYGVALNHVLIEDKIYFHCAHEGRKLDNIKENPNVSMTFVGRAEVLGEDYTTGYESVIIEGTAQMVTEKAEKKAILLAIGKRFSPFQDQEMDAYIDRFLEATAVGCINIEKISGKANDKRR